MLLAKIKQLFQVCARHRLIPSSMCGKNSSERAVFEAPLCHLDRPLLTFSVIPRSSNLARTMSRWGVTLRVALWNHIRPAEDRSKQMGCEVSVAAFPPGPSSAAVHRGSRAVPRPMIFGGLRVHSSAGQWFLHKSLHPLQGGSKPKNEASVRGSAQPFVHARRERAISSLKTSGA